MCNKYSNLTIPNNSWFIRLKTCARIKCMATGWGRLDSNRSGCSGSSRKQKPLDDASHLLPHAYRYHCHINMNQLRDLRLWHHSANSSIRFVMRVRWLHLHILFNEKKKMLTNVSIWCIAVKLSEKKITTGYARDGQSMRRKIER